MSAITELPGNLLLAFNYSPILQASWTGYMPEIGFSSYAVNELQVVPFMAVDVERKYYTNEMSILKSRNSAFEPATCDDIEIFDTVTTWSTF